MAEFTKEDAQKVISALEESHGGSGSDKITVSEDGLSISYGDSYSGKETEIISFKADGNSITSMSSDLGEMGQYSWIYKHLPEDIGNNLIEATKGTEIEITKESVQASNDAWHGIDKKDSEELRELTSMTQPTVTPTQAGLDFSDSEDVGVGQREVAFTNSESGKPILASFGAAPCVIVAAYNPETKEAALAHVDASTNKYSVSNMLKELKGDSKQDLEIHLAGAVSNSGGKETAQEVIDVIEDGRYRR